MGSSYHKQLTVDTMAVINLGAESENPLDAVHLNLQRKNKSKKAHVAMCKLRSSDEINFKNDFLLNDRRKSLLTYLTKCNIEYHHHSETNH